MLENLSSGSDRRLRAASARGQNPPLGHSVVRANIFANIFAAPPPRRCRTQWYGPPPRRCLATREPEFPTLVLLRAVLGLGGALFGGHAVLWGILRVVIGPAERDLEIV